MTPAEPVLISPYPIDPMPGWVIDLRAASKPVWVFAYGSLMWNPEIRFAERLSARVYGWHRGFCLYSPEYRGTREKPGLVLGLDRGGSCRGIAYRLATETLAADIDYLWTREMTGFVYHMTPVRIVTARGATPGYAFTVRRDSRDYAGRLAPEVAARIIATSKGDRGTGRDYLANTVRHLEELGIADGALDKIERLVAAL
ncbi:MAG TPA: gamma-glutamylcyclotransferase [Stellaceae bacterium]|jgi:cation transport protein ChaC|nr:gamma-glutamylcyclotransferase [Stellaceae bacterium]